MDAKTRIIQPPEQVRESLQELQKELVAKGENRTAAETTILFKINSCLYARYPASPPTEEPKPETISTFAR